jgi:hypothetical protein
MINEVMRSNKNSLVTMTPLNRMKRKSNTIKTNNLKANPKASIEKRT